MSARDTILDLRARMGQDIIGQGEMVTRLLIGLLANGNLLVEGLLRGRSIPFARAMQ
jgi:MoxR-like ATPase